MKKRLLLIVFAVEIVQSSFSMAIRTFKDADTFIAQIFNEQGDISQKKESIRLTIKNLQEADLDQNFRVAVLDQIRSQLSDIFPFVADLVRDAAKEVTKSDLYDDGKEKELGMRLFSSQQTNLNLNVLLRAARLLNLYDQPFFLQSVKPFMEAKRLGSYI